ncbi:MAG: radical SAM protein [Deltaproteobacteria bacterium]|nr:radical SAM protein [Deltaproteobacteria bacterium]
MKDNNWRAAYLRLHPQAALKRLERPFVYHIGRDELYEIDEHAHAFLLRCDGTRTGEELATDAAFVEYCREEELLEFIPHPAPVHVVSNDAVIPSLRYLELQLTHRCNLNCSHCYRGAATNEDLPLTDALRITREFSSLGGLRLMISGGEPLLHRDLREFIAQTADLKLRRVLLSNGLLIDVENIKWLTVEEIQFSLDGWTKGHDTLRGAGAFERTMQGVHRTKEAGIPFSFATMIHRGNLDEFELMRAFMEQIGAVEWGIDLPVTAGALENHRELLVSPEEAAPFMAFSYGGGYHGSSDGYACGRHLLTVLPGGQAVKCGFYGGNTLGDACRGLKDCWLKLKHVPLDSLECRDCPAIEECAGECRFRAPHPLAPDPLMCALYGQSR